MNDKKKQINEAYEVWVKEPNPANMTRLLRLLDSDINSIIGTYGGQGDANIKWEARAFLAEQIRDRFDPTKSNINTFIYQSLQRLPRIIAAQKNVIHVPESSDRDMRRVDFAREKLLDKLNREPSLEEIADNSGISVDRIKKLDSRFAKPSVAMSSIDSAGVSIDDPTKNLLGAEEELHRKYTVQGLTGEDKELYSLLNNPNPPSKADIAKKFGISAPAVSQRITKLEKRLSYGD